MLKGEELVNLQDSNGRSPLTIALLNKRFLIAKLLLEYNASVDQQDKEGRTALILASENGYSDAVKVLKEYGANVNQKDNKLDMCN